MPQTRTTRVAEWANHNAAEREGYSVWSQGAAPVTTGLPAVAALTAAAALSALKKIATKGGYSPDSTNTSVPRGRRLDEGASFEALLDVTA
ncbi:hypothetical protein [Streptomyces malaysiensis]|uniref:Uncharacterized protein n=1 Tax=Streptomyces malaysiensis TaxID=92644 RepID=A0A7X6B0D6_STRMQ|nr:hypothetical protein [Streptomyces malaysiensis]NIY69008.1 hypothetical protein [Streptomyces malaysiensis]